MDQLDDFMEKKLNSESSIQRFEFKEEFWLSAQQMIEAEEEKERSNKRGFWWWRWLLLGIGLLGLVYILYGNGSESHVELRSQFQSSSVLSTTTINSETTIKNPTKAVESLENPSISAQFPSFTNLTSKKSVVNPLNNSSIGSNSLSLPNGLNLSIEANESHHDVPPTEPIVGTKNNRDELPQIEPVIDGKNNRDELPQIEPVIDGKNNRDELPQIKQIILTNDNYFDLPLREKPIQKLPNKPIQPINQSTNQPISPIYQSINLPILPVIISKKFVSIGVKGAYGVRLKDLSSYAYGLTSEIRMNRKISFHTDLLIRKINLLELDSNIAGYEISRIRTYAFGFVDKIQRQKASSVNYLEIPISVSYNWKRFSIEAGLLTAFRLKAKGQVEQYKALQYDQSFGGNSFADQYDNSLGVQKSINTDFVKYYWSAFYGVECHILPRLSIGTRYQYRFKPTDSIAAERYFATSSIDLIPNKFKTSLDFYIKYQLFSFKK
jgi:hypothetical protein